MGLVTSAVGHVQNLDSALFSDNNLTSAPSCVSKSLSYLRAFSFTVKATTELNGILFLLPFQALLQSILFSCYYSVFPLQYYQQFYLKGTHSNSYGKRTFYNATCYQLVNKSHIQNFQLNLCSCGILQTHRLVNEVICITSNNACVHILVLFLASQ